MDETVPGVLRVVEPRGEALPLLFDSPHSGRHYPDDFGHALTMDVLRQGEDAYVDELYQGAPEFGATLLSALFPRAYVDVNRHQADIDPDMIESAWPEDLRPGEKTRLGVGLIRRFILPDAPIYARRLSVSEVQGRLERYYWPYHRRLEDLIESLHRRFGALWHVNCHSMKSFGNASTPDGAGAQRPDMVLSDVRGRSCDGAFTQAVGDILEGLGYQVVINDPYIGGEIVRRYGRPEAGRHSLQIEIRRALYMDETTLEKSTGFERLKGDLDRMVDGIRAFVRRAIG